MSLRLTQQCGTTTSFKIRICLVITIFLKHCVKRQDQTQWENQTPSDHYFFRGAFCFTKACACCIAIWVLYHNKSACYFFRFASCQNNWLVVLSSIFGIPRNLFAIFVFIITFELSFIFIFDFMSFLKLYFDFMERYANCKP